MNGEKARKAMEQPFEFRHQSFDTGKVRIGYGEGPQTGQPFVFLHGGAEGGRSGYALLERLSPHWHVYAPYPARSTTRGRARTARPCLMPWTGLHSTSHSASISRSWPKLLCLASWLMRKRAVGGGCGWCPRRAPPTTATTSARMQRAPKGRCSTCSGARAK
jgi:hypothetical protein